MATPKEIVKFLLENKHEILVTQGHRVSNGADYYQCGSCYTTKDIKGYASITAPFNEVEHDKSCALAQLNQMLDKYENHVENCPSCKTRS